MTKTFDPPHDLAPPGARLAPAHWWCRARRHREVRWVDDTPPEVVALGGGVMVAECAGCGRYQARVRVVYPRDRTIPVTVPRRRAHDEDNRVAGLHKAGADLDLDQIATEIEQLGDTLIHRLAAIDILDHPRLKAVVVGLGPRWLYLKEILDDIENLRRRVGTSDPAR